MKQTTALRLLAFFSLLMLIGYLTSGNSTFDIHLHDTYFIIAKAHFYFVFGLYFLLCAIVYGLLRNQLSPKKVAVQVVLSAVAAVLMLLPPLLQSSTRPYVDLSLYGQASVLFLVGCLAFVVAFLFLLGLVLLALFQKAGRAG